MFKSRMMGAVAALGALALAGCDNGDSAVETRDRSMEAAPSAADAGAPAAAASEAPAAEKARWSANRSNTAEQNIQRLFERNGGDFAARTADDYVNQAHAFIASPPAGSETVRRANGDTLFYHAATNTFLVADREGTPRTMFKPDDGPAYWQVQKDREAARSGD